MGVILIATPEFRMRDVPARLLDTSRDRTKAIKLQCVSACVLVLFVNLLSAIAQAQSGESDANLLRLQQAVAAISDGQLQRAESLVAFVLATAPRDADALNLLGVVRARQQRAAEAERLFRRALIASPAHIAAHVNLGELYITTNQRERALTVLLAAHKLAPMRDDVNFKLAELYSRRGEHTRAFEHLTLVKDPAAGQDYYHLRLTSLVALDRVAEARNLAREFAAVSAGDPDSRSRFALLLAGGGLTDEAFELLSDEQKRSPESFPVLFALGVVSGKAGHYEKAEQYLMEALRIRPGDIPTLRALARAARANGKLEKALAHLVHARRLSPHLSAVLFDFGATALQMDLLFDAINAFEQLVRTHPQEPAYIYALAVARLRNGEAEEASKLMRRYVASRPQDASGHYLLGDSLHSLNQFAAAKIALERSLALKSEPDVEYLLGITLEKLGDRARALAALRRVVRSKPDHAPALTALGAILRERREYAEARKALERAVEVDPKDLRANYQLGLVYAMLGDKEASQKMFARADDLRGQQRNRESVVLKLIDPPEN